MIRQQDLLNDVSKNLSRGESGEEPKSILSLRAVQKFLSENCSGVMLYMATGLSRLSERMKGGSLEKPWLDVLLPKLDQLLTVGPCPADIKAPLVQKIVLTFLRCFLLYLKLFFIETRSAQQLCQTRR